jgi:hypothetical protein
MLQPIASIIAIQSHIVYYALLLELRTSYVQSLVSVGPNECKAHRCKVRIYFSAGNAKRGAEMDVPQYDDVICVRTRCAKSG